MYKVFFNEYRILFLLNGKDAVNNNSDLNVKINCVDDFFRFLNSLEKNIFKNKKDFSCSLKENVFHEIFENFTCLPAAGGVVINNNRELLFIKRMNRWDLPKGKMEEGESPEKTALREVSEECGIYHQKIVKQLPSTIHLYRSPFIKKSNNWVVKKTFWFEMSLDEAEHTTPQTEEDISDVKWFSSNQLKEVYDSTYRSLKGLLDIYMK